MLARALAGGALLAATLVTVRSLSAQTITGTVVLADSATPVRGVIVLALDGRGVEIARGLTSASGQYSLRAGAPGRYHLRLLRIGYRPTEGPRSTSATIGRTLVGSCLPGGRSSSPR